VAEEYFFITNVQTYPQSRGKDTKFM